MHISSIFSGKCGLPFALMLGFATVAAQPLVSTSEAQAQGYHSGSSFAGKRAVRPSVRSNRAGIARSGVRLGKRKHYLKGKRSNFSFKQRQRQIQRRNELVQRENEFRRLHASTRRSIPNGRFLSRDERAVLLNDALVGSEVTPLEYDTGTGYRRGSACPSGHDCGYRLYSDGTGPRIITPGVSLGNGLPNHDGLNGPKIITLD